MNKFDFPCVECGEIMFDIDSDAAEWVCWKCGAVYSVRKYPWIENAHYLALKKKVDHEKDGNNNNL